MPMLTLFARICTSECYSTCPPWFERCNKMCADKPWYMQRKWVKKMKKDKEFAQKAKEYIPMPLQQENRECYSTCPPWFKRCNKMCADKPWYLQEKWVKKMEEDASFAEIAKQYIPMPIQQENRECYSTCPPWFERCNKMCADKPWYLQDEWVELMKTDSEFAQKAKEYIPMPITESNGECHSACPPWFKICTMQCMPEPWYQQIKWLKRMEADPEFIETAKKYLPKGFVPTPIRRNGERPCYSTCPPWFKVCNKMCADKPWFLQEKWAKLLETDPEFRAKAMPYFARQG